MRYFFLLFFLISVSVFRQDACVDFRVENHKSPMHLQVKKHKLPKYPDRGITVFGGFYGGVPVPGSGATLRINSAKWGFSMGWDSRTTNPGMFVESNQLAYTNAYGVTLGKYKLIGDRVHLDVGVGFGYAAHSLDPNPNPVFGYGLASYRVYKNVWLGGSVHPTDFESVPRFNIGLTTLVW